MADFLKIHPGDNVAVALQTVSGGTVFSGIVASCDIPQGHKMALTPLKPGDMVIKYGFPIGQATREIQPGDWVHSHNLKTNLTGQEAYCYEPRISWPDHREPASFLGYRRPDGRAAIRNEVWIIPTVGCVNDIAEALVRENQDLVQGIDGLYAFPHPFGCSQTGEDHTQTRKLLTSLAQHPNAGGVLVLSLGCENLTQEQFIDQLGDFDREKIRFMVCQQAEDEMAAGRALLEQCIRYAARFQREPIPASELVLGLKCGGSDGLSGITANAVVGRFSDLLIGQGGTTILTEVPEMFGAEGMLMDRCITEAVFRKTVDCIQGYKDYFLRHNEVIYENPSPGNRAGGITTLEEKSCGCVQKGGTAPIVDVLGYADRISTRGLNLLYGPGNDLVSSTALAAAGAHMVLFTTGRGTPFGAPVPTVKIATNTPLAEKKHRWIDFNAGSIADGQCTIPACAEDLMALVLEIASGGQTKSEKNQCRQIAIFKNGVVL